MPRLFVTVLLVLLCSVGAAQQAASTLQQIIPGHYMYSSSTYNSGVIVTSEGVVVLDALNTEAVEGAAGADRQDHPAAGARAGVRDASQQLLEGEHRLRGCAEDRA